MINKTCPHCTKPFKARANRDIYCSATCYHLATRAGGMLTCKRCGSSFYRKASRIQRGEQYCSKACELADAPKVTKSCPRCGKEFTVLVSQAERYTVCSRACRLAATKYVACQRCGKVFVAEKHLNRHYCSEECRRPPRYIVCRTCGIKMRVCPGETRQFCSFSCYRRSIGETRLEKLAHQTLDIMGIAYRQEVRMGRYSIDFLLPSLRIALEMDGDYWHRDRSRDERKEVYLARQGWRVVRIAQSEVEREASLSYLFAQRLASAECPPIKAGQLRLPYLDDC